MSRYMPLDQTNLSMSQPIEVEQHMTANIGVYTKSLLVSPLNQSYQILAKNQIHEI